MTDTKLGVSGTVFWQDQSYQVKTDSTLTFVSSNKKAVVMPHHSGGLLAVSVCDPTQANIVGINIGVTTPVTGTVSADSGISVTQLSPTLKFTVATSGARGNAFHAVFLTTAAVASSQIPVAAVAASTDDGDVPSNTIDKYSQGFLSLGQHVDERRHHRGTLVRVFYSDLRSFKNATDLVYTSQVSNDLLTWQSGSAYFTQLAATDLGSTKQQQYTDL